MREKQAVRKEMTSRLREQDFQLRVEGSGKIQKMLLTSEEYRNAGTVMTYVSLPLEVSTEYFIKETLRLRKKRVVVPYIGQNDQEITASELTEIENLEKGPHGAFQPKESRVKAVSLKEIDLIVVPAVAFDKKNMRLGRGKGYYDRFLSKKDLSLAKTIGLAFRFQVLDQLPSCPYDKSVTRVITD
ncbi:MAG: 5-formyltetrahydrofolate cyclo-ligase [Candidatus Omnitrophota bacterium]